MIFTMHNTFANVPGSALGSGIGMRVNVIRRSQSIHLARAQTCVDATK